LDIVDAHACLWTAQRVLSGEAVHFPRKTQFDSRGLRTEIIA
jgi:predicted RNase H-like nuclease